MLFRLHVLNEILCKVGPELTLGTPEEAPKVDHLAMLVKGPEHSVELLAAPGAVHAALQNTLLVMWSHIEGGEILLALGALYVLHVVLMVLVVEQVPGKVSYESDDCSG